MDGNGSMIAFIPQDAEEWSANVENPHMTLVYAGEDLTPTDFNELAKDAAMLASFVKPFHLVVAGKERFGADQDVDALKLRPTWELWSLRRAVEKWNKSEFDFTPHVTIGPAGTNLEYTPKAIRFNKIVASMGDNSLVFRLGYSD